MTDKEIIKALECCISDENCESCSLHHEKIENACTLTVVEFYKEILDLINRQQSAIDVYMQENDRLKTAYIQVSEDRNEIRKETEAEIEAWKKINQRLYGEMEERRKEDIGVAKGYARIEAIKEFADEIDYEILHKEFWNDHPHTSQVWLNGYEQCMRDIRVMLKDKLKEMVGEDK